jgi:hypothetical protein
MSRIPNTATGIQVGRYLVMRGVAQVNIADGDDPVAGVELVGGGGGGAAQHVLYEDAGEGGGVGAFWRLQLAPHYGDAQALSSQAKRSGNRFATSKMFKEIAPDINLICLTVR